ncbi:MAG: type III-A CRISPR-associated RAMP protein Csm4 [Chitinophagales bacterium]|nr:type III-A CRISPR-associated RAMP protein Csm4 [Chitinophagales bacterium]
MTYTAYYLHFNTPLHIGDYKPESYEKSESFLRSDTIVAAIISAWAKSGHEDWIGDGDLPFTISSAFPFFCANGNEVMFFPRLKSSFKIKDHDSTLSKAIKKITWLDQYYFEKVINNEDVSEKLSDFIRGDFLSKIALPQGGFMQKQVSERVQIPRERNEDNQSEPFYMERIYFEKGGLYFLATGDGLDRLEKALNLLQYEGFGTDRSIGNGFFEWNKGEVELSLPDNTSYAASLGLYVPESRDKLTAELDDNTSYDLIKRGGWITTDGYQSFEKNSIYMFTEGSVFKKHERIDGKGSIDLSPSDIPKILDHKIYRSGKTIFIPVKL